MGLGLFNYSDEQLDAIWAAIESAGLRDFDLEKLNDAADSFLDEAHPGPAVTADQYRLIAEAAQRLRISMSGSLDDQVLDAHAQSIEAALCRIEDHARDQEFFWHEADPKARFYWTVLDMWRAAGGQLGYSRRHFRNGDPSVVDGPTVRYLEAVTRPVMGDRTPGRELIKKIIKRHKALDRDLEALG